MDKIKHRWEKHRPSTRRLVQLYAALLYNAHLKGFVKGEIYTGKTKGLCVPGLNCYSCPAAVGACPLGALQNAVAASARRPAFYAVGVLLLFGLTLGRTICGWLCPFGLLQELLHKLPSPKLKKGRLTRALSWVKYVLLAVLVLAVPLYFAFRRLPLPAFCKYICPAGTLEGAVALLLHPANGGLRDMLGPLFVGKLTVLLLTLAACVFIYRPFCRFLCPLGAIYSLTTRLALVGVKLDETRCTDCGVCKAICPVDIRRVGDRECVACGKCIPKCPEAAISFKAGKIVLLGMQNAKCKMQNEAAGSPVGAVIGRPPEAAGSPVGAVIGRPPEAEASQKPAAVKAFPLGGRCPSAHTGADEGTSQQSSRQTAATTQKTSPARRAQQSGGLLWISLPLRRLSSRNWHPQAGGPRPPILGGSGGGVLPTTDRFRKRGLLAWALALLVLLGALVWFNYPTGSNETTPPTETQSADLGSAVGQTLPDFTVETLNGETFTLSAHRGEVVVINLWATWCGPCVKELPIFEAFAAAHPNAAVLAVHGPMITEDVPAWLAENPYDLPFAVDADGTLTALLGASNVLPHTLVLDRSGVVLYNAPGSITLEQLEELYANAGQRRTACATAERLRNLQRISQERSNLHENPVPKRHRR